MNATNGYSVESLLTGGGGPETFKFPTIGTGHSGTVTSEEVQQSRAYNPDGPGALEFWEDGRPKLQLVLTLVTDLGEERRLFAKGLMQRSLKVAASQHRLKSLIGCRVTVTYTGDTPKRAKEYAVTLDPPAPGSDGSATPVPQAEAPAPAPDPAPVSTETPQKIDASGLTPDAIEALRRAGLVK